MERIEALEPWAALIVGEPVRVVRNDALVSTKQAYGLATWNPELKVKEIQLDGRLFTDTRSSLSYVFYHECGHLRLAHTATGDHWHKQLQRVQAGETLRTEEQAQAVEEQADEFAFRLMEEFAHFYLWDFLNGTLVLVDGSPVYVWDTDDIELAE